MHLRVVSLLTALLLSTGLGCLSDPMGWRRGLRDSQLSYTQSMRWGNLQKASAFVEPELREAFLESADEFANIRITDYDIGAMQYESSGRATVKVTYRAYALGTYLDRVIRETQKWRRAGFFGQWWVQPTIQNLVAGIERPAPRPASRPAL